MSADTTPIRRPPAHVAPQPGAAGPKKFTDIPEPKKVERCERCGQNGGYRMVVSVKAPGRVRAVVSRTWEVCEGCGATLVTEIQKVFER